MFNIAIALKNIWKPKRIKAIALITTSTLSLKMSVIIISKLVEIMETYTYV
jgi:hypothetical protein